MTQKAIMITNEDLQEFLTGRSTVEQLVQSNRVAVFSLPEDEDDPAAELDQPRERTIATFTLTHRAGRLEWETQCP